MGVTMFDSEPDKCLRNQMGRDGISNLIGWRFRF